jgi:superfamily II DNA/RNA helicase
MGAPSDKAQYVHRIGHTGRAGKDGSAVLLLCPHEASFADQLRELPITPMQLAAGAEAAQMHVAVATALARVGGRGWRRSAPNALCWWRRLQLQLLARRARRRRGRRA